MNSWLKEYVPADSVDLDLFCRRLRRIFETGRPKQRYTIVKSRIKNQAIRIDAGPAARQDLCAVCRAQVIAIVTPS